MTCDTEVQVCVEGTSAHSPTDPRKGRFGLVDHEKAFCPDASADVFDARGIARDAGCVVVRPDQHVTAVLPLDAHDELTAFFSGVLIDAG